MAKVNYAEMVDPNKLYRVSYIITQSGERVEGAFDLLGCDLTENQIKEVFGISRGGKRQGAGRKCFSKLPKIQVSYWLDIDIVNIIRSKPNQAEFIQNAVKSANLLCN